MKSISSATTSSRDGSVSSPMISRSTHGLPCAARPTITAAAPVVASTACARARERDVAGGDHRHVDERDELGRQRVVGGAGVHLLRRARMQRQRRGARLDEPRADVEARRASRSRRRGASSPTPAGDVAPATASTRRQAWSGSSSSEAPAPVFVTFLTGQPKFMSTMSAPGGLDHPRRLGHRDRVGAEDLDRQRVLVGADPQVAERPLVAVLDPGHGDHLRADEPGAVAAALAAKCLHADACHRARGRAGRGSRRRPRNQ